MRRLVREHSNARREGGCTRTPCREIPARGADARVRGAGAQFCRPECPPGCAKACVRERSGGVKRTSGAHEQLTHVVGHFGADAELGKGDCKQTDR